MYSTVTGTYPVTSPGFSLPTYSAVVSCDLQYFLDLSKPFQALLFLVSQVFQYWFCLLPYNINRGGSLSSMMCNSP